MYEFAQPFFYKQDAIESHFLRSTAALNSDFSFSNLGGFNKVKKFSLPFNH